MKSTKENSCIVFVAAAKWLEGKQHNRNFSALVNYLPWFIVVDVT